jgi:hypothetical protein
MLDSADGELLHLNPALYALLPCTFSDGNLDVRYPARDGVISECCGHILELRPASGTWEVTPNNTVQAAVGMLTSWLILQNRSDHR